ncbi:MAG: SPOR domain-containing protein [Phenylobacterium sp.]|jgi:outer membrane biosynthesis protein TonB
MSDPERGAYTPPHGDAPLSFDPRQPTRGSRPLPLTLILSVLVLAGLVAAIVYFYQSGVRQAGDAPRTVGEAVTDIREAAPAGAQPVDPAAGLQIYKEGDPAAAPAEPKFAPPPETPAPRPAPVVQPPAPVATPAIKPTIPAPAPAPIAKAPAPKAEPPKVAPSPPSKTEAPKQAATAGAARVQIGAVSSPALADKAWNDAVAAAPGLAAGKGKAVEKIEGGALYRTFVTGFASRAEAQAFCARLQSAGKSCFVR